VSSPEQWVSRGVISACAKAAQLTNRIKASREKCYVIFTFRHTTGIQVFVDIKMLFKYLYALPSYKSGEVWVREPTVMRLAAM
jgi:hypothetical protein